MTKLIIRIIVPLGAHSPRQTAELTDLNSLYVGHKYL